MIESAGRPVPLSVVVPLPPGVPPIVKVAVLAPAEVGLTYDQQHALVAIERDYLTRRADVLTAVLNEPGR